MADSMLVYDQDDDGRPRARPRPGDVRPEIARLAQFLSEDVRWPHYADLLLTQAEAARAGSGKGSVPAATGNAYAVSFSPGFATIAHLHLSRGSVRLPIVTFELALRDWRSHLATIH
jgi:hypothetical protein